MREKNIVEYRRDLPDGAKFIDETDFPEEERIHNRFHICGYTDADYGIGPSRHCAIFMIAGGPYDWKSSMITTVSPSTLDAEMKALFEGVLTAAWTKLFMDDFGHPIHGPILMFQDNRGVIDTLQSDGYRHRLRHIMNVVCAVREMVHAEIVKVVSCTTQRQLADIGTKVLGKNIFKSLCSMFYPRWRDVLPATQDPSSDSRADERPEIDHPP